MNKFFAYGIVFLLAANISVYAAVHDASTLEAPHIHFLSVGQGDAELIQIGRMNFLIDTGPSYKTVQELDALIGQERRVLDVVMLTHPNSDHVAGLLEIAKRYTIRMIVTNGVKTVNALDRAIEKMEQETHIPVVYARQGMDISLANAHFSILWPGTNLAVGVLQPASKLNDAAIVGVFSFASSSALFTGDISQAVEKQLAGILSKVDILKVSHHGSKYSSSRNFLLRVHPDIAIIEAGKNSYGLPAQETLQRLADIGAQVFRVDLDGQVNVLFGDKGITLF